MIPKAIGSLRVSLRENTHEYALIGFSVLDPVAAIDPPTWTSVKVRYEFINNISNIRRIFNILSDIFCLNFTSLNASIYWNALIIVAFGDTIFICAQLKENEAKNNAFVV